MINHELEELEEDESTHEDANGIRHKKFFKDILRPFYNPLNLDVPGLKNEDKGFANIGKSESKKAEEFQNQTVSDGMQVLQMSPFSMFNSDTVSGGGVQSPSSPRVSETVTGGVQSGLNQGQGFGGIQGLPPDLLQRLKGNYSGRATF